MLHGFFVEANPVGLVALVDEGADDDIEGDAVRLDETEELDDEPAVGRLPYDLQLRLAAFRT